MKYWNTSQNACLVSSKKNKRITPKYVLIGCDENGNKPSMKELKNKIKKSRNGKQQ